MGTPLDGMAQSLNVKGFWSRPEGKTGTFLILALGCAAIFWGWGLVVPFVLATLEDTFMAGLLAVGIILFVMFFSQKRIWTLINGMFRLVARGLTSIFITIDPIGIMKDHIKDLAKSLETIAENKRKLSGQIGQLKDTIQRNLADVQKALGMAKAAKERNKQAVLVLNVRSAGRLKQSNITLEQLLKKLEGLFRVIGKMEEVSQFMFEDIKDQVKNLEMTKRAVDAGYNVMRATMSFIRNASDDQSLYDETVEKVLADNSQKLGEIDDFMNVAQPFIDTMDIKNLSFEEDALADLEKWEKSADNLLLGDTKQLMGSDEELMPLLNSIGDQVATAKVSVSDGSTAVPNKKYLKT